MSNPSQQTAEALRQCETELGSQTKALTHFRQVVASHELRLLQLEHEVNELCQRHGEAGRYPIKLELDTKLTQAELPGDGTGPLAQTVGKLSAELRESEERYRLLFESLDEGYCVIEKVGGAAGELLDFRYVEANPAFAAQTGLNDVLGKTLRQVLPDVFEERIRTYDAVHRTGASVRFQREFVNQGRVLELYAFRVEDKTHGRVGINLQDITERKQAERQLRQNHDTFFNLIENAPFGVYVVDAQFRLRQVSTASQKVFSNIDPLIGRDFEEVLRLVWADPFVSEALGHFRHTLQTGEAYSAPNTTEQRQNIPEIESYDWKIERITLPDGQLGVVCYFYDITERMQAQAALRDSEAFSRSILKSSPDCINVLDLEGNLLSMQSGQELLGIEDVQHLLNKSWLDFWTAENRRSAQALVESAAAGGAGSFVGFLSNSRGEVKWWDVAISPILDANGRPARLLAVSRDVTQRQQAEDVLRQRTAQFETLLNEAPLGVYLIDADFRIQQANPAALSAFGNMPDLIGRDFAEVMEILWPTAQAAENIRQFRHTLETGEACFVSEMIAKLADRPTTQYYEWQVNRILLPDGRHGVVCYFRDISERVLAQQEIRNSEKRYRGLFNSMDEGFAIVELIFDEKQKAVDYRFLEVNLAFEKQTGIPDATGKRRRELTPDQDAPALEIYSQILLTGEPVRFANKLKSLGRYFDVYATRLGGPGSKKIAVVFSNITERREAEEALRESERRFRALVLASSDLMCRMSPDWSEMRQIYDKNFVVETEVPNSNWLQHYVHRDDQTRLMAGVREALRTKSLFEIEHRVRLVDGSWGWMLSRAVPLLDAQGEIVEWFGTGSDVTEKKRAAQALRESERFLRSTLDALPGHIAVLDESGTILEINEAWQRFGNENHALASGIGVGVNYLEHCEQSEAQDDQTPAYVRGIKDVIAGTKTRFEVEYPCHSPTEQRWFVMRVTRFRDPGPVRIVIEHDNCTERKLAEDALRESEERYRSLFNSIDAGFCIIEMIFDEHDKALDYRFLEVNPAFERQTGMLAATGKRMRELVPDLEEHWFKTFGQVALMGEPIRFVRKAKAMSARWFDVYAVRLGGPDSRKVALLFNNITERIRRERNLNFLVELQQTLAGIETSSRLQQVASKSIAEYLQLRHCLLTEINQGTGQATVLHEHLAEEAPALVRVRPLTELRTEAQRQALAAGRTLVSPDVLLEQRGAVELQRLAARGVRSQVSAPYVVDGHWTFLLTALRGQPYDWPQDEVELITELAARVYVQMERARAQERLVESEERLRLAAEAAHFGMYDRDLGGGHFHVSGQLKQMLGYEPDSPLSHQQVISHFHLDDQREGLAAFQYACDPASDGQIAVEQRIVRLDGAVRWISNVGRVLHKDGVPQRSIGFWVDITERKQLERETLSQAQTLTELDRRKDEFLAMLGHELRNPLAALANAAQLLRLQEHEDLSLKQCRGMIERQIEQLKHLVDDLLEVSRITTGNVRLRWEQIVLSDIVARAVETAQPLIRQHRHRLQVSLPLEPVHLFADAARLEQVLINLLTNAAKYTDECGDIWLSVELEKPAEMVEMAEKEAATAMVVIRVRDTGIGIAPELLLRIFDLFTQADRSLDRSQGGLGIGLCLVQRLVELHGGTVQAHSVLGEGSEFVVRLPLSPTHLPASPAPPLPAPDTAVPPKKSATGCQVLVVDDNVDAAQSLGLLLEMSGNAVRLAYDGPSALQAAIDYRPDVVLLDIGLPGLDGFEVAQQIRCQVALKGMVLVALTGYGQDTDRQRSQDAGFDYHLVKPASFDEIEKILLGVPERVT